MNDGGQTQWDTSCINNKKFKNQLKKKLFNYKNIYFVCIWLFLSILLYVITNHIQLNV